MRKPLVAGNWKMNLSGAQAEQLAQALVARVGQVDRVQIVVCPPFPYLLRVRAVLAGSKIALGAQNCHHEAKGAFTGEVSPTMLVDCGCQWVIVGHSERRGGKVQEKDDLIRKKINAAHAAGLHVILCVGETLFERQNNETPSVIENQLVGCLEGMPADKMASVVLAYEPVWAIGTGHNATPQQAQEVQQFIRNWLDDQFGAGLAAATRVLYGGSVKPDNAGSLLTQPDVDGALVGGASLVADDFVGIINAAPAGK
jgi:triosephosphate isomerase